MNTVTSARRRSLGRKYASTTRLRKLWLQPIAARPSLGQSPSASRANPTRLTIVAILCAAALALNPVAATQQDQNAERPVAAKAPEDLSEPPAKVEVQGVVRDVEIRQRLADILETTGWFGAPEVRVQDGIVFLKGTTETDESRTWAGNLARNTEGVVAVVNQIEVVATTIWDFAPAFGVLSALVRSFVRMLPLIVVAIVVIATSGIIAKLTVHVLRRRLRTRALSSLMREVAARTGGVLVVVVGLYLVLRIAGLTQLAFTVVGGTGLIGLALGIAFRDITENFLASLFLSLQQPFREGDLVEVANITGYVQRLTSRTTVLMALDGNQVQVPNATVFKSTIRNFTSNPNRRDDFIVGIGYDDSISAAQEVALEVLAEHPAILKEPEPLVLVENLGSSAVNLRVYFWFDGSRHSSPKVKSSVIRLIKKALQDSGVSMPDESRGVTFPHGLPLHRNGGQGVSEPTGRTRKKVASEPETVATKGEAGLQCDAEEIKEQARNSWTPGENLLTPPPSAERS